MVPLNHGSCEHPGCVERTREGKPYCYDHLDAHPYVRWLESAIKSAKEADDLAGRVVPDPASLDANITVRDLVVHLENHGPRTEERLGRELSLSVTAVRNYSAALETRGAIERAKTRRGSTVVRLVDGFGSLSWLAPPVRFDMERCIESRESDTSCNMGRTHEQRRRETKSCEVGAMIATGGLTERLEAAQKEHLRAAGELLRLRGSGASNDDVAGAAQEVSDRWVALVTLVSDMNVGAMAVSPSRGRAKRTKPVSKQKSATKQKSASKPTSAPKESNASRIFDHLSRNVGRFVPASALIKHIHTQPKCSSMQANLSSAIARFRRHGYRITKSGEGDKIRYMLSSTKPR